MKEKIDYDLDNHCNFSGFVASGCIWFKRYPEPSQGGQPGSHTSGYRSGSDYLKPSWDSLVQVNLKNIYFPTTLSFRIC